MLTVASAAGAPVAEEAAAGGDWGSEFLDSARQAFLKHEYADALRLASHASVETPKDAKVHELMSLALFALKDYRGANLEAHAALSLAPAADWPTLYGYYQDLPTYEQQLNALVADVHAHPDAADARFVLAYHDLMMGHKDAAKAQFETVLAKVPQDEVAVKLLKEAGGAPPATFEKAKPGPIPGNPQGIVHPAPSK
jgi:thioredoxin-like negative regulator of GroEL